MSVTGNARMGFGSDDDSALASLAGISDNCDPARTAPWRSVPYRLVSLFEMLEFHATIFAHLIRSVAELGERQRTYLEVYAGQDPPLDEAIKGDLSYRLRRLREICVSLELDSGADKAQSILFGLLREFKASEMTSALSDLQERIEDQLKSRRFLFVPISRAEYYEDRSLLGQGVNDKFSECIYDADEAGKCFALGRWTAAVFHLMRVTEQGIRHWAKKLKTNINTNRPWGNILQDIEPAIRALPTKTSKQQDFKYSCEQLKASLHAVKDAWRNPTMHPKATYTEEEAKEIFDNVKSFMRRLADVV
jgi:hypothetical protein